MSILFGCSPPSKSSEASSNTIFCASTNSLLNNLNLPFLPQPHLLGSLNLESNCRTVITFPQLGHSNLALVTCGRTSDFCLTKPLTNKNLLICLLRISLIIISMLSGRAVILILKLLISPSTSNCSSASSPALITSSGLSKSSSANSWS